MCQTFAVIGFGLPESHRTLIFGSSAHALTDGTTTHDTHTTRTTHNPPLSGSQVHGGRRVVCTRMGVFTDRSGAVLLIGVRSPLSHGRKLQGLRRSSPHSNCEEGVHRGHTSIVGPTRTHSGIAIRFSLTYDPIAIYLEVNHNRHHNTAAAAAAAAAVVQFSENVSFLFV
jgi:hypothetical protein